MTVSANASRELRSSPSALFRLAGRIQSFILRAVAPSQLTQTGNGDAERGVNGERRSDNEHGTPAAYGERHGSYGLRPQSFPISRRLRTQSTATATSHAMWHNTRITLSRATRKDEGARGHEVVNATMEV